MSWKIQKIEGIITTDLGSLPPFLSEVEVKVALQRLVCTRLTEQEVIADSPRHEMGGHSVQLERVRGITPVVFGHGNVQYVATLETMST